jgi:tripartite-type tricarboxylate transporter receptor subunit TctC
MNARSFWRVLTLSENRGSTIGLAFAFAALLALAPTVASAQADYPNRTIKIIVPIPPGPILDVLPRVVGEKLAAQWHQPVIVENRPGFAQNIGAEAVFNADPDGYTLLFTPPGPLVISQFFYPKLGFDPTAFAPITVLVKVPATFVVNPKVPASTLQEFIAYAKVNPNKITYGSPGAGSTPELAMEKFQLAAGIHLVHVPYQGLGPAMVDLLAGHIDVMIDNLGNVAPHVKDGGLKLLAVTTAARLPTMPEVPTVSEVLPGYEHQDWFAFMAPPKTPPAIATKLSLAIAETLKLPEVAKRLDEFMVTPVGNSPAETAAWIKRESDRWRQVISESGASPN